MLSLRETLTFDQAGIVVETKDEHNGKSLYMKGICIQGGVKNANQRVYPVNEIQRAVSTLNDWSGGYSVPRRGSSRSHNPDPKPMVNEMWMDGSNGYGKLVLHPWDNLLKQCWKAELNLVFIQSGNVKEDDPGSNQILNAVDIQLIIYVRSISDLTTNIL